MRKFAYSLVFSLIPITIVVTTLLTTPKVEAQGPPCDWIITNLSTNITGSTGPCSVGGYPIYIKFGAKCGTGGIIACSSINREWWLTYIDTNCGQTFADGGESTCEELVSPRVCGVDAGTITDCLPISVSSNGYYKLEYKLYGGGCPPNSTDLLEDYIVYLEYSFGNWFVVSNPCP